MRSLPEHNRLSLLKLANLRVTIYDLWSYFGYCVNSSSSVCRSPFRLELNPSFSVCPNGHLFHDFATGDGGGVVQLVMLATGLDRSGASKRLINLNREQRRADADAGVAGD